MTPRQQVYAFVVLTSFCISGLLGFLLDASLTVQQQSVVFMVPIIVGVLCGIVAALLFWQEPPK